MIEKLNKREQVLLFVTGGAAILWLLITLIIEPVIKENERLNDQIKYKMVQFCKMQKLLTQKNRFKDDFSKVSKLDKPDKSGIMDGSKLLKTIDELQKKTGIQIENIAPVEPEILSFYKRLMVKVEVNDSMENIIKFIAELKNTPGKLNLVNITIMSGQNDNLKTSLTVAALLALK